MVNGPSGSGEASPVTRAFQPVRGALTGPKTRASDTRQLTTPVTARTGWKPVSRGVLLAPLRLRRGDPWRPFAGRLRRGTVEDRQRAAAPQPRRARGAVEDDLLAPNDLVRDQPPSRHRGPG